MQWAWRVWPAFCCSGPRTVCSRAFSLLNEAVHQAAEVRVGGVIVPVLLSRVPEENSVILPSPLP